jgi:hypothetical protein
MVKKWTYDKLEKELWAARKRFKTDKEFIPFIAGWFWNLLQDIYCETGGR